jgi:hypothetical protein
MDELPPAPGADPARRGRGTDGRFLPGNPWAKQAKVRSGPRGVLATLEAAASPEWRAARRWGRRAAQHRIREYQAAHGADLSSGVCGLLTEGAELRADAAYLRARAAHDNNPELLRIAAQLSARAAQCERDAWALATLEREARPKDPHAAHRALEAAFGQPKEDG